MATTGRSDLRDAICSECGVRCIPGQTHLQHNGGWKKKVLMWDWHELAFDGYPGWDLVESQQGKHPPFVKLMRRSGIDKSSLDIDREFDDIATGKFYSRDWTSDGIPFVCKGDVYHSGWWFQKREDAQKFILKYGGTTV